MRWCLYILSVAILLSFGIELCSLSSGSVAVKGTSHLVLVLDDDEVELKLGGLRDHSFSDCGPLSLTGQYLTVRWVTTDLNFSLEEAKNFKAQTRVRLHRWLCRECC